MDSLRANRLNGSWLPRINTKRDKSFLPSYHEPLLARRSEPYVAKEATTPELAMADRCFASLSFTIRNSHFVFPEVNLSTVSPYPVALNIISDCWILFAVIWLVAAFWTKRSVYH